MEEAGNTVIVLGNSVLGFSLNRFLGLRDRRSAAECRLIVLLRHSLLEELGLSIALLGTRLLLREIAPLIGLLGVRNTHGLTAGDIGRGCIIHAALIPGIVIIVS